MSAPLALLERHSRNCSCISLVFRPHSLEILRISRRWGFDSPHLHQRKKKTANLTLYNCEHIYIYGGRLKSLRSFWRLHAPHASDESPPIKERPMRVHGPFFYWWRWGESNPRPKTTYFHFLRAQSLIRVSPHLTSNDAQVMWLFLSYRYSTTRKVSGKGTSAGVGQALGG